MDLSIIIVNWNSNDYLQKCVASIVAWTRNIEYEIIVIDNGSFDGCGEMLREKFRQVQFIQSDKNIGFSKANNIAFKASSGRNILFLNPDTEIEDPALETLSRWLDSLPDAGAVGAKLLNCDRTLQTSCIQAFPTLINQLLDSNALQRVFPKAGLWGTAPLFTNNGEPVEVDAVSGACLMIKRAVFERVAMFGTEYFMYSEDIDLCFKVKQAGWHVYFVPPAVVVHFGGACSSQNGESVFSSVMLLESRWRFFRKTRPAWYCWFYRLVILVASMARIGMVLFVWPLYGFRGRTLTSERVMRKWIARLRWTLGNEGWVRNY